MGLIASQEYLDKLFGKGRVSRREWFLFSISPWNIRFQIKTKIIRLGDRYGLI